MQGGRGRAEAGAVVRAEAGAAQRSSVAAAANEAPGGGGGLTRAGPGGQVAPADADGRRCWCLLQVRPSAVAVEGRGAWHRHRHWRASGLARGAWAGAGTKSCATGSR